MMIFHRCLRISPQNVFFLSGKPSSVQCLSILRPNPYRKYGGRWKSNFSARQPTFQLQYRRTFSVAILSIRPFYSILFLFTFSLFSFTKQTILFAFRIHPSAACFAVSIFGLGGALGRKARLHHLLTSPFTLNILQHIHTFQHTLSVALMKKQRNLFPFLNLDVCWNLGAPYSELHSLRSEPKRIWILFACFGIFALKRNK